MWAAAVSKCSLGSWRPLISWAGPGWKPPPWPLAYGPGTTNPTQHRQPTAVVLPHRPAAPRLSLLLAAPEEILSRQPAALARSCFAMGGHQPPRCGPACRLEQCPGGRPRGTGLAADAPYHPWPCCPCCSKVSSARRRLRATGLAPRRLHTPSDDPLHQEPGCLAGQTSWWKRLLPLSASEPDATLLLDLRRRAAHRGAGLYSLPLAARTR